MSRTVAIVQARMGSTRLPGKVLMDLAGKPMLRHVVERLRRAGRIDEVVVATSVDPQDRAILDLAKDLGCRAIAGSENDVLDRYVKATEEAEATTVVRVTSDCPLIDPDVVDWTLQMYFEQGVDYAANCIQQTFPRGLETEVFSAEQLRQVAAEANLPLEREHVTPHFYLNPDKYRLRFLAAEGELYRPDLRLCVDTPEDLALLQRIFAQLGPDNRFPIRDVVHLLDEHRELLRLNEEIRQKK
ncbi:MAG: NTP transferase domain-containing protein, partial [bacterium]|nr:NTP transferase domain-containing protein [bacterium]